VAEVIEKYVKKGDKLYVEGRTRNYSYEDANGNKKFMHEVLCNQLELLAGNNQGGDQQSKTSNQQPTQQQPPQQPDDSLDESGDLPF
jgi:single-strand DNA-binding protein